MLKTELQPISSSSGSGVVILRASISSFLLFLWQAGKGSVKRATCNRVEGRECVTTITNGNTDDIMIILLD